MMNDIKSFMEHGCEHYRRHCLVQARCCSRFISCRRCHDDNPLPKCDREMDRSAVQHVKCCECGLEQMLSEACQRCGQRFGRYFCPLCRFYDDNIDKHQFHCHGCGICRVGPREKFIHCDKCCVCYGIATFASHKCVEAAMDRNCPVCLEFLHTSTEKLHVPACGHILHQKCFNAAIQSSPTCPVCKKSYADLSPEHTALLDREVALTPMPPELRNNWMYVLCNDCHSKSYVRQHIVGHKCGSCGGYNTAILGGPFEGLPAHAQAEMAQQQHEHDHHNHHNHHHNHPHQHQPSQPSVTPPRRLQIQQDGGWRPPLRAMRDEAVGASVDDVVTHHEEQVMRVYSPGLAQADSGVTAPLATDDLEDRILHEARMDSLAMLEARAEEVEHARASVRSTVLELEASSAQAAVLEADAQLALLRGLRDTESDS
eukprot:TRINITY_DN2632_c0_g1_i2.p1 TRINITY_DN2632_c0_g1~~TRINITY_DN2632_c0_g1_i2.p1  ORF type:complete len:428 (+),score=51.43 TRINITY_DN2632_c0_g1_i2:77-1360(+)